jgi:enoyl-[acyl-carrier-protein] reductase (NADH)
MITDILLSFLIALLSFMGKAMYDKIEKLINEIRQIMLNDVANKKDIDMLKDTVKDHEHRLNHLENK